MKNEVLFDALNDNIFCNHKIVTYKGTFYHYHDAYELFLLLNGNVNYYIADRPVTERFHYSENIIIMKSCYSNTHFYCTGKQSNIKCTRRI